VQSMAQIHAPVILVAVMFKMNELKNGRSAGLTRL
jgi:hypothetical protein